MAFCFKTTKDFGVKLEKAKLTIRSHQGCGSVCPRGNQGFPVRGPPVSSAQLYFVPSSPWGIIDSAFWVGDKVTKHCSPTQGVDFVKVTDL